MKETLRDINAQIMNLTEELIDAQDIAEENAIIEALHALKLKRETKLENIAYVRLQQKAEIKAIDAEIKRLHARKHATENAGRRLDLYVMVEMQNAGIKHHRGTLANLTIAKSPIGCIVTDPTAIPDEFLEERREIVIKKAEAITYHKVSGQNIAGLKFHQSHHLRIK